MNGEQLELPLEDGYFEATTEELIEGLGLRTTEVRDDSQWGLPWHDAGPIGNPDICLVCPRPKADGPYCNTHASEEDEALEEDWRWRTRGPL